MCKVLGSISSTEKKKTIHEKGRKGPMFECKILNERVKKKRGTCEKVRHTHEHGCGFLKEELPK